jgi:hypothetical protein
LARRWSEVRRLAAERRKAAKLLEDGLNKIAAALTSWGVVDEQIAAIHPVRDEGLSYAVHQSRRADMFRLGVNKLALPGYDLSPSVAIGLPSIEECIRRDESVLLHGAPE